MVKSSWTAQDDSEMEKLAQKLSKKSENAISNNDVNTELLKDKLKKNEKINLQVGSDIKVPVEPKRFNLMEKFNKIFNK